MSFLFTTAFCWYIFHFSMPVLCSHHRMNWKMPSWTPTHPCQLILHSSGSNCMARKNPPHYIKCNSIHFLNYHSIWPIMPPRISESMDWIWGYPHQPIHAQITTQQDESTCSSCKVFCSGLIAKFTFVKTEGTQS